MIRQKLNSAWIYIISFLLLALMGNILFGGLNALLSYKKSADSSLQIDSSTLHFFTKEYLTRSYYKLTAAPEPDSTELPSFRIYTSEQDIASLNSNLPESAKTRYISGHIKIDKPELSSGMEVRYRGGLPLHWLYEKKSFRVKLPPYTTYKGLRSFNLVNPSTVHTITDLVSYNLSRELGLLTPDYFPARVYINDASNGLHYFLSQVDESFLRKNRRMPGSIYSGDTIFTPNPFEASQGGVGEDTFLNEDGDPLMWEDERMWEKDASRNAESAHDRRDIQKYIDIINTSDPTAFMEAFNRYFDKDKFYTFWGIDTLVGSYHHDNFHNHKIYFDPYKGKFEPIQWDIRFWSKASIKDIPINPLMKQIILNPILEYERDKRAYSLLQQFPVDKVSALIDQANSKVEKELAADKLRQAPDSRYGRFALDKEMPFSMKDYEYALEELKLFYLRRHEALEKIYGSSLAQYTIETEAGNELKLTILVSGNSPIFFEPTSLIPSNMGSKVTFARVHEGKEVAIPIDKSEILYPGRLVQKGNAFGATSFPGRLALGDEMMPHSPLAYSYKVTGISQLELERVTGTSVTNAITGQTVPLDLVSEHPSVSVTASLHPWDIIDQLEAEPEHINLSGEIFVNKDIVFSANQIVTIAPGTVFSLDKNASIVFYGRLNAIGTNSSPIQFKQATQGEPWGSIVVQGASASGSHLSHIQVSGGSVTSQRLINYPGQINIHDVSSFKLDNCLIRQNQVGDDSLHVSYSQGEIKDCRFEDTAFDAVDIDIADVEVSNVEFYNAGNDALDLMTSKVTVNNALIVGAGDKCFSIGESSQVTIKNSHLEDCQIGVAVKDESEANLEELKFHSIREWAIALYRKNPRYSSGGTVSGENLYGITEQHISKDSASKSLIDGQHFLPITASSRVSAVTGDN